MTVARLTGLVERVTKLKFGSDMLVLVQPNLICPGMNEDD